MSVTTANAKRQASGQCRVAAINQGMAISSTTSSAASTASTRRSGRPAENRLPIPDPSSTVNNTAPSDSAGRSSHSVSRTINGISTIR